MIVHIKINTDEALSTEEVRELVSQSAAKGVRPEELATAILRDGIRSEVAAIARETKKANRKATR